MQLDDLNVADDREQRSYTHRLQEKTNSVGAFSAQIGLNINKGKSKVLKANAMNEKPVRLGDELLEEVYAFTYLGSLVGKQGAWKPTSKLGAANQEQLSCSGRTFGVSTDRIFNSKVKPVQLFGSETWRKTVAITKTVQTLGYKCLRQVNTISNKMLSPQQNFFEKTGMSHTRKTLAATCPRFLSPPHAPSVC